MRADFFMEELNNGVKLCQLIGVLRTKIAESCPSALCKVSQTATMRIAWTIVQRAAFMLTRWAFLSLLLLKYRALTSWLDANG